MSQQPPKSQQSKQIMTVDKRAYKRIAEALAYARAAERAGRK